MNKKISLIGLAIIIISLLIGGLEFNSAFSNIQSSLISNSTTILSKFSLINGMHYYIINITAPSNVTAYSLFIAGNHPYTYYISDIPNSTVSSIISQPLKAGNLSYLGTSNITYIEKLAANSSLSGIISRYINSSAVNSSNVYYTLAVLTNVVQGYRILIVNNYTGLSILYINAKRINVSSSAATGMLISGAGFFIGIIVAVAGIFVKGDNKDEDKINKNIKSSNKSIDELYKRYSTGSRSKKSNKSKKG
ncbi:MAG: hypothetical protein ARM1_0132 [Candidatus Micrarchaeota archaeon]|nr:MAG: hypothetical protein ARM1_0132 [Candidatus Micrarchaeota archaeon]